MGRNIDHLSPFQKNIFFETKAKGNCALYVPMGTGKTIIAATVSLITQEEMDHPTPILIIASKSLISDWEAEFKKFFGDTVSVHIMHHQNHCKNIFLCDVSKYHVIITTPEVMTKQYKHYEMENKIIRREVLGPDPFGPLTVIYEKNETPLGDTSIGPNPIYTTKWAAVVIDEGHHYLNHKTHRTRAMIGLSAHRKWILSGTILAEPKPDNIMGYGLLIDNPDVPRNFPDFLRYFYSRTYRGIGNTLVKRKRNEDYDIKELGQIINTVVVSHPLRQEEADLYMGIKNVISVVVSRLSEIKHLPNPVLKAESKILRGMVMGMFGYLKETLICPLVPITSMYIRMSDLKSRDSVVASFAKELLTINKEWLNDENAVFSSRLKEVCHIVNKHPAQNVIIFSAFRTIVDLLRYFLPKSRPFFTFEGSDTASKRHNCVSEWGESTGGIMALTHSVGSCGLNLQKGSVVICADHGWNADIDEQCIARMIRRGQKNNNLFVYHLTSNTGMEADMFKLHEAKLNIGNCLETGKVPEKVPKMNIAQIIRLVELKDNCKILKNIHNIENEDFIMID